MDPRRKDRRFHHGMLGPVKSKEIALPSAGDYVHLDAHAFLTVIDGPYPELVVPAAIAQYPGVNGTSRKYRWLWLHGTERGLGKQEHIVGNMEHSLPVDTQVLVSLRAGKRP